MEEEEGGANPGYDPRASDLMSDVHLEGFPKRPSEMADPMNAIASLEVSGGTTWRGDDGWFVCGVCGARASGDGRGRMIFPVRRRAVHGAAARGVRRAAQPCREAHV